jgi:predicted nucleic acid-binding protein
VKADFAVVLDACVLAEAAVSDLLLRLAEEPRLLLPKWSAQIWTETRRTWIEKLGWPEPIADKRIQAAKETFPEAWVEGFEHLIELCENHPKDRHVLAVAIHKHVKTIVTFNLQDFPAKALDPWGIVASHPSEYLRILFEYEPEAVVKVLEAMAARARRTLPEMLGRLAWHVKPFSDHVGQSLMIEIPDIAPQEWRR